MQRDAAGAPADAAVSGKGPLPIEARRQWLHAFCVAVNAESGDLLWRFEHYTERYVANCVTPIYHDGHVFVTGGYGKGSVLLAICSIRPRACPELNPRCALPYTGAAG